MNVSSGFFRAWTIIKNFVEERTLAKVTIDKQPSVPEMWDIMHPSQVEKVFGGEAETTTENFWPPMMPSDNYGHDQENLCSLEEHQERCQ
jgi:hypothetical protein